MLHSDLSRLTKWGRGATGLPRSAIRQNGNRPARRAFDQLHLIQRAFCLGVCRGIISDLLPIAEGSLLTVDDDVAVELVHTGE